MVVVASIALGALALVALPLVADAGCTCAVSGDPHFLTCDAQSLYAWQGTGLYSFFKTSDVELQCELAAPLDDKGVVISQAYSFVSACRLKYVNANTGCTLTMQTGGNYNQQFVSVGTANMTLSDVPAYFAANVPGALGVSVTTDPANAQLTATIQSVQGPVSFIVAPYQVHVSSNTTTTCNGMCGTCAGPVQVPTTPDALQQWATRFAADGSGLIQPIAMQPATCSAPTTAPAAATKQAATPAPTSSANASTAVPTPPPTTTASVPTPPMPVKMANNSVVPDMPVFESADVLRRVIDECLCGQPKERYYADQLFGKFVENCISDKAHVGAEKMALSNMNLFQMTMLAGQGGDALRNSTQLLDLATCAQKILTPTVTVPMERIPVDAGATYVLTYTATNNTGADKLPYLRRRPTQLTGTGEPLPCTSAPTTAPSSAIPPVPSPAPSTAPGATASPAFPAVPSPAPSTSPPPTVPSLAPSTAPGTTAASTAFPTTKPSPAPSTSPSPTVPSLAPSTAPGTTAASTAFPTTMPSPASAFPTTMPSPAPSTAAPTFSVAFTKPPAGTANMSTTFPVAPSPPPTTFPVVPSPPPTTFPVVPSPPPSNDSCESNEAPAGVYRHARAIPVLGAAIVNATMAPAVAMTVAPVNATTAMNATAIPVVANATAMNTTVNATATNKTL
ncbi:Uncharacterized protein PBTT_06721 [Plasmodiophora brassicae]